MHPSVRFVGTFVFNEALSFKIICELFLAFWAKTINLISRHLNLFTTTYQQRHLTLMAKNVSENQRHKSPQKSWWSCQCIVKRPSICQEIHSISSLRVSLKNEARNLESNEPNHYDPPENWKNFHPIPIEYSITAHWIPKSLENVRTCFFFWINA